MTNLIMALFGLSLPAMIIGNPMTYSFALIALILAFTLPQVREAGGIHASLNGLMRSQMAWVMGGLILVLYVGTIMGIRPEYSIRHWALVASLASVMVLLCHVFRQFNAVARSQFLTWMVWGVQASFIIAFAIAVMEPWALPRGYYGDKPWTETHLRFYSSVLAVILPFCWMVWLRPVRNGMLDLTQKIHVKGLLWVCASFVLVLLCEGRAGWLGVVASALTWMIMMKLYHGLKMPSFVRSAGLAIVTLGVSAGLYILLYGQKSIEERIGVTIPDRGLGGGRLDIWHLAYQHVFDQPWFGIGMNGFRFLPGADYHPHNFVLQLWLEAGIVGLGLALVLIGLMAYKLYLRGKTDLIGVAGLAALAGFVVSALTNKSVFNPEWLVVLMVVMAFALAKAREGKEVSPVDPVAKSDKLTTVKPVVAVVAKVQSKASSKAGKFGKRKKGRR